jgi:hypothetical protein
VIEGFSKYAYSVAMRSKTDGAVASVFRSILARTGGRRQGKVNARLRKLLDGEGIQMRLFTNPDGKCAIVERFNMTLKSKLYNWFTRNKTYRYVDVLDKFVLGYNDSGTRPRGWSRFW